MPDLPLLTLTRITRALGCEISITALHRDLTIADRALCAAFAEISRIECVMSVYCPQSQLSQLNLYGELNEPDPYLVQALEESREISRLSAGAFDVTVQPLWILYATARASGKLPTDLERAEARQKTGWQRIFISAQQIRLEQGMAITLNGIAQGFAADRAAEALRRHGIENALIDTGEISALGHKADGTPWRVGIQHPRRPDAYIAIAELDGRSMTTSGDYETKFTDDFVYHHIFDPGTGRSPAALSSVTVVAPSATLADGLSTAIFVLGPERGLALAQTTPGVEVLLITKNSQSLMTEGFPILREADVSALRAVQ